MPRIGLYIILYKAIIQLKRRNAIINLHSSFFGIEKTYRLIIYILPNS